MGNIEKIMKVSGRLHLLLGFAILFVVGFDIFFWTFLNDLPQWLITVNSKPAPLVPSELSPLMRFIGFGVSLLPVSAVVFGLYKLRELFSFYCRGDLFSAKHSEVFKSLAKTFIILVFFSIIYESAKSVLFSLGNPPGSRVLEIGVSSHDISLLFMGCVIWVISWVVDEGRLLSEENELTI